MKIFTEDEIKVQGKRAEAFRVIHTERDRFSFSNQTKMDHFDDGIIFVIRALRSSAMTNVSERIRLKCPKRSTLRVPAPQSIVLTYPQKKDFAEIACPPELNPLFGLSFSASHPSLGPTESNELQGDSLGSESERGVEPFSSPARTTVWELCLPPRSKPRLVKTAHYSIGYQIPSSSKLHDRARNRPPPIRRAT